jgi:hypothetical protein
VDIEGGKLVQRMEAHFDPDVSDEEMSGISPAAIRTTSGFDALTTCRVLSTGRGTWRRSPPRMLGLTLLLRRLRLVPLRRELVVRGIPKCR